VAGVCAQVLNGFDQFVGFFVELLACLDRPSRRLDGLLTLFEALLIRFPANRE
jgi:hypothetical protein